MIRDEATHVEFQGMIHTTPAHYKPGNASPLMDKKKRKIIGGTSNLNEKTCIIHKTRRAEASLLKACAFVL